MVGPGNAFVTLAKREVFGAVGIDQLAGPSEILVIASSGADARLVAAEPPKPANSRMMTIAPYPPATARSRARCTAGRPREAPQKRTIGSITQADQTTTSATVAANCSPVGLIDGAAGTMVANARAVAPTQTMRAPTRSRPLSGIKLSRNSSRAKPEVMKRMSVRSPTSAPSR